jgi:hypothetical protein
LVVCTSHRPTDPHHYVLLAVDFEKWCWIIFEHILSPTTATLTKQLEQLHRKWKI